MEVFNDLWNKPEQYVRPPNEGFEMFTMEEWIQHSSTYKILTGSFRSPLPAELEEDQDSKLADSSVSNRNVDVSAETSSDNTVRPDAPEGSTSHATSEASSSVVSKGSKVCGVSMKLKVSKLQDNVTHHGKHLPGGKKKYLKKISSLTADEQRDCLYFFMKFRNCNPSALTGVENAEFQLYQSLQSRVSEEQREFMDVARSAWAVNKKRATTLSGSYPFKYIQELWRDQVQRVLRYYKHKFKQVSVVPLIKESDKHITMSFEKPLLQIGSIPFVRFPDFSDLDGPYRTTTHQNKLRSWSFLNLSEKETGGTLHQVPVSGDPNAERLARLHSADVVLSSSGFKMLLDNYHQGTGPSEVNQTWCLPVIIKQSRAFENGVPVMKKTVFVDKPLPNSEMTGADYVRKYYKHGFQASTIRRDLPPAKEFDIEGAQYLFHTEGGSTETQSVTPLVQSPSLSLASPNPPQSPPSSMKSPPKSLPHHTSTCQSSSKELIQDDDENDMDVDAENIGNHSDEDDEKLIIDWVDSNSESELITHCGSDLKNAHTSESYKKDTKEMPFSSFGPGLEKVPPLSSDESTEGTKKSECVIRAKSPLQPASALPLQRDIQFSKAPSVNIVNGNALPLSSTNVTYNLWSLAPQEHFVGSSQPQGGQHAIRVLVRCRIDACEKVNRRVEPAYLACKPEFQLEYAAEVPTISTLTRQWGSLLIRPDTKLARGRVNVCGHEIVMVERCNVADIESEAKSYHHVELPDTLHTLYTVFSDLLKFPCGEYMLTHQPHDGSSARLFTVAHAEDPVHLNLAENYQGGPHRLNCDIPWLPLDPSIILPRNEVYHTMPCMFHPIPGEKFVIVKKLPRTRPSFQPKKAPTKSTTKKRKKKKKKQLPG